MNLKLCEPLWRSPKFRTYCSTPEQQEKNEPEQEHKALLNFRDHSAIYRGLSNAELHAQLGTLHFVTFPYIDRMAPIWLDFFKRMRLEKYVYEAIKPSIFMHFCAGETIEEATRSMKEMKQNKGLQTILFLSTETADADSQWYDSVCQRVEECVIKGGQDGLMFCAFKIGGLVNHALLRKLNEIVRADNFIENLYLHKTEERKSIEYLHSIFICDHSFSQAEKTELLNLLHRMERIFLASKKRGVRQMIDAEQTYFQDAIDFFALFFMLRHNDTAPVVWSTYQMYRKDTMERLKKHGLISDALNFHFAFKLVRGAYMNEENTLAAKDGLPSPIHDSVEDTSNAYNTAAKIMIDIAASNERVSFCVASHNENSTHLAASYIKENNLDHTRIYFAQLKGMSDYLSVTLARNGFNACKLIPFGRIEEVIPYIMRRLTENSQLFSSARTDKELLLKEVSKRIKLGYIE